MSDEHFTVDGTLIQAWASQKSFRSKDGSDDGDGTNFHGQKRSNKTHESITDADARLYKKSYGKESKLSYLGHALVENRNGLIAAAMVTHADGYAERDAALLMLAEKQEGRSRRITVGADKAYDTKDFISTVRELNVTAHVTRLLRQVFLADEDGLIEIARLPVLVGERGEVPTRVFVELPAELVDSSRAGH